jgi:hypothetical protein
MMMFRERRMAARATRQSTKQLKCSRFTVASWSWQPATVIAISLTSSPSNAQVIPSSPDLTSAPWSAQRVFEPTPLADLRDPSTIEQPKPEDTPVRTRVQPGYEPVGIRSGSWMFNPSMTAGTFFDSNVFSSNTMKQSDVAAVLEPALRAHTLWDRHGIDLKLGAQSIFYGANPGLDQTSYGIRGSGWIDVARDLKVLTSFQASHLYEGVGTISSPANAVQPTPYDLYSDDITVRKEFNRWAVAIGGGVESYNFGSTRAQNGTIITQDARDGQIYTVHGRTDYAFSSRLGWFASAEFNQRDLRGTSTQSLDSHGYELLTGLNVALTNLITGEFGVGYVNQRFDDPTIGTIEGPAYRAMLTWSPTRLIDVHLKAEQVITQTSDTSVTGVIANAVQLGADYELLRNVVISVAGGYENDQFHGEPRTDKVSTVDSRIKYMLNRFASVSVFHKYIQRDSNISSFSYDKNLVGLNVTAQF